MFVFIIFSLIFVSKHIYRTDVYATQIMTAYMGLIYRKVSETDMEEFMKIFDRFTGPTSLESLDE